MDTQNVVYKINKRMKSSRDDSMGMFSYRGKSKISEIKALIGRPEDFKGDKMGDRCF